MFANRLQGAPGPPAQPNTPAAPSMAPGAPPMAPAGPPAAPGVGMAPAPPPAPPDPVQIKAFRAHLEPVVKGLGELVSRPRGDLTKKDAFDAVSTMIAKGAFPTDQSKQGLIAALAKLPDDELGLRKALGGMLLQASATEQQLGQIEKAMGIGAK